MKFARGRDKILLHLQKESDIEESGVVPYRICQRGIAEAVDLSRSRTSKIIRKLKEEGLIDEETRRVVGLKRRRKVYSLTNKGLNEAQGLLKELGEKEVTVKKKSSNHDVKLKNIDSHVDSRNPLLTALNKIDKNGVINLEEPKKEQEDVFADREEEMQVLLNMLDRVSEEGTITIVIKGQPGIGKTRLLNEFKEHAVSKGFEFFSGSGHFESSEPHLPFYEILDDIYEEERELEFIFSNPSKAPRPNSKKLDQEPKFIEKNVVSDFLPKQNQMVFNKVSKLFKNISEKNPLVVFVDDLQWVDKSSLMLFHYLSTHCEDAPILLIGAYRHTAVDREDFLNEILYRMGRDQVFQELELGPLGWEDIIEMVQGLFGSVHIPDDFLKLVHEISKGNPLVAKEIVKQMKEEDIVSLKSNEFPTKLENIDVPKIIDDIIKRRLRNLEKETIKVLETGSVIGEEFEFSLLKKVMSMDSIDLLEHVDILTGSEIWETEPGENKYSFTHELVHKVIYEDISEPLRRDLHQKTAEAIKDVFEKDIEEYYSDLAFHYNRADMTEEAMEHFIKGGERAQRLYAPQDALDMFEKALDLADKENKEDVKLKILENLGDVYINLGEYEKSLEYYENIQKEELSIRAQQRLARKIAKVLDKKGEFNKGLDHINRSLKKQHDEYTIYHPFNEETLKLLYRKGWIELKMGKYTSAEKDFLMALDINDVYGDKQESSAIFQALGTLYTKKNEYEDALEYLDNALKTRKDLGDKRGEASTLNSIAQIQLEKGNIEDALSKFKKSLDIFDRIGDESNIPCVLTNIGSCYFRKGDLEKAYDYQKQSYDLFEEMGHKRGVGITLNNLGNYYFRKGDPGSALEYYRKSKQICERLGLKYGLSLSHYNIGTVQKHKGNLKDAEKHFKRSIDLSEDVGDKSVLVDSLSGLSEVLMENDQYEDAIKKGEKALEISNESDLSNEKGVAHKTLGLIYGKTGDLEQAEEKFESAIDLLEEAGESKELGESHYHYAQMFDEIGDQDKKEKHLNEARSIFEKINMDPWLSKCGEEAD